MKIKVCPDFCSTGLWNEDDGGTMLEFEELGLPKELQDEIDEWLKFYDKCHDKKLFSFIATVKRTKQLNDKGLKIAKQIKKLRHSDVVVYMGETKGKMLKEKVIV